MKTSFEVTDSETAGSGTASVIGSVLTFPGVGPAVSQALGTLMRSGDSLVFASEVSIQYVANAGIAMGALGGSAMGMKDLISLMTQNLENESGGSNQRWPSGWRKSPGTAAELAKGGCENDAKILQKWIGGDILHITPKPPAVRLGPVKTLTEETVSFFMHDAVIKDGIVYDKLTGANGLSLAKYKELFLYAEDIIFGAL